MKFKSKTEKQYLAYLPFLLVLQAIGCAFVAGIIGRTLFSVIGLNDFYSGFFTGLLAYYLFANFSDLKEKKKPE